MRLKCLPPRSYHLEQRKRNGVLEKSGEIYSQYCDHFSRANSSDNSRQCWQRLVYHSLHDGPSIDSGDIGWTSAALMGVGKFLYNILMRDIKIDTNVLRLNSKTANLLPAFYTLFRNHGKMVKEEVKPHPVLTRLYRSSQEETITFDANLVPMLCPPIPWSTCKNGGYLTAKSELVRLPHQAFQQLTRLDEMRPEDLYPSLDSLNQLASIPWNVNTDVSPSTVVVRLQRVKFPLNFRF
jgi:DNA-directed RNA polymerase, mitochondrial